MLEVSAQLALSLRLPAPADGHEHGGGEREGEVRLTGGHGRALVQCGQQLVELDSAGAVAATRALPAWCGPSGRSVAGVALCSTRSGLHAVIAGLEGCAAAHAADPPLLRHRAPRPDRPAPLQRRHGG